MKSQEFTISVMATIGFRSQSKEVEGGEVEIEVVPTTSASLSYQATPHANVELKDVVGNVIALLGVEKLLAMVHVSVERKMAELAQQSGGAVERDVGTVN